MTLVVANQAQEVITLNSANVTKLTQNFGKSNYAVRISIYGGFGTLTLKSEDFKNSEVAQTLRANGVKSKDSMPVYEYTLAPGEESPFEEVRAESVVSVGWAKNQLINMLQQLQERYLYFVDEETGWLCSEDDLPAVNAGIQAMRERRERLHEILQHYLPMAETLFMQRITNVLTAANKLSDLDLYVNKFPSPESLDAKFRVRHSSPIRIPSLVEQLASNSQALQALAEQTSAESSLSSALALQQMQQSGLEQLREAQQQAANALRDELYQLVADSLTEMEELGEQSCGIKIQNRLERQAHRIEAITNMIAGLEGADLADVSETVNSLRQGFASPSTSRQVLQSRIAAFRQKLRNEVQLETEGQGHKALAAWLMF